MLDDVEEVVTPTVTGMDVTLFNTDEQQPPEMGLFEPPVNPVVVPLNAQELAAQIAGVDERQLEMPFTDRLRKATQDLNTHGAHALVSDIALQDRSENLRAMRAHAESAANLGDAPTLESAARMIQAAQTRQVPDLVEGHKAVAHQSLELSGIQYAANRYRSFEAFDEVVQREGDMLSLRNIVAHESAKLRENTSTWDHISYFFSQFLYPVLRYKDNRAISGVTGIERYFDTEAAVNDFRQLFRGLEPTARVEIVRKLAEQQIGLTGDNKAANIELLRKLAELTKADDNLDTLFGALTVLDIGALTKGLAWLVRRGVPLRTVRETAGEEAAAKVAAADLMNKTQTGGLNDADLMAKFLAVGKNPMDADPAAFAGMSAAGQTELRASWDAVIERTRNRLLSSGLMPDEVKQGLSDIRASYSADTNKSIHSVIFGEGSERGQEMTVFWQSADGQAFTSKEAAEAWAQAEGKVGYAVVPRNAADEVAAASDDAAKPRTSPTSEWLVREQRTDPLSFENVGKFSNDDIRSMPWLAIDPKHAASQLAVEERVIGVHAEAKTRKDLVSFLSPSVEKLSKASKRRVMAVLEEGDAFSNPGAFGKEWSYQELAARGLNEAEARAYFAARQVRMVSYHLRNGEMVRALRAEGFKEVELLADGSKYAGRVLEREQAGQPTMGRTIWDTTAGKQLLVDSTVLDDAYAAGKRVVQFKQPVEFNGKLFSNVIVDQSTAKWRDIVTALHYRPGEFSRIYSDQYFIELRKMKEVDGVMQEVRETVRTAASAREAEEYVSAHKKAIQLLIQSKAGSVPRNLEVEVDKLVGRYTNSKDFIKRFNDGEFDGFTGMDFHYSRNKEEFLNASVSEAMTNGRLFTSKRGEKLFSVDRDRRNTLDVFESLEAEITNISRVANISQWRETMVRRWMNTFGDMIPNRTGNDVADFYSVAGGEFTKTTQEALFAKRTHAYIMRQLGVRTHEERFWEGVTRTLTERLFRGNEKVETIGAKIRSMPWLDFVRNVNFNLNLGMFNPAQLLVQANGAATAMLLSPLHGLAAAKTFPLLRMALMSDNPDVWRKLASVQKASDLGLSSADEFVQTVKAIRTAGILDNMKSTALWNMEEGALNVFAGYPQRAAQSHTFFFNRGEEFSRVVSFDVARRDWIAKNPGKDWTTDEVLKKLVVRMDDLTQNMTKANQARFQTGVLSVPFQFAQYNIKLAANVMTSFMKGGQGRGFTRAEATQLLLGHVALYGAAGNGLMGVLEEVLDNETKESLSVEKKQLLAQGLLTWLFDQTHQVVTGEGAKVAMGSRLGSFDYWHRIGEAIFTDKTSIWAAALGPSMSSAKRLGVVGEVARLWARDPDLTGRDVLEGLAQMGSEQVASLRNAAKAYLYLQHQGKMLDRHGVALAQLNKNELLWQALGFAPTATFDIHQLIQSKQAHGEALDDIAHQIFRVQRDITTALNNGDPKRAEEQRKLLVALWPENAGDVLAVERRIRDRLFPHDTQFQKLLGEYLLKGQTYSKPVIVTQEPREATKPSRK